jgi:hypothetical protein
MDYKHTIDILTENIKELGILISGFKKYEKIPDIEMDLALAKTRNLYDVLLLLKKSETMDGESEELQVEKSGKPVGEDDKISREKPEELKMGIIETTSEPQKVELSKDNINEKNTRVNKENIQVRDEPKIISDRFKKQPASIHDNIKQVKQYQDLSSKLQAKPISNLAKAIGLNEKYAFIHELFQGDAKKYEETIQILNNASNFNEAYNYLIENFDWNMDSELVQLILELIRRKLIISKDE